MRAQEPAGPALAGPGGPRRGPFPGGRGPRAPVRLAGQARRGPGAAPRPTARIAQLEPYQWEISTPEAARLSGLTPEQVVRLDTNTCPWQLAGLEDVSSVSLAEYPDSSYADLTERLAEYAGVASGLVTVGAGADEILALIARTYLGPQDLVVVGEPSYGMFRVVAEAEGAQLVRVPDGDSDRLVEVAARARLVFLCNPNNPTGALWPQGTAERLAAATPGLVVVDEAYFEFAGVTAAPLVTELPNLVVVRTLSKAFGLAGARVGYCLAGAEVTRALARLRPPASVSSVSAALGVVALSRRRRMQELVAALLVRKLELARQVSELGLEVRPTATNFLLASCPEGMAERLLARGLVVRTFPAPSELGGWMRVTVRDEAGNLRLLQGVAELRTADGGLA